MTYKLFDFEGITDGANLTTGNSGAAIINPSGGTIKAETDAAAHGTVGAAWTGGTYNIARLLATAASNQLSFCGCFSAQGTLSTGANAILGIRTSADSQAGALNVRPDNSTIYFGPQSGGFSSLTFSTPFASGTKYWVALQMDRAAGTVAGQLFALDGTALSSFPAATANLGTSTLTGGDFGTVTNATVGPIYWDAIQFNDGTLTPIPPLIDAAPTSGRFLHTGTAWRPINRTIYDGSTWRATAPSHL